MPFIILGLGSNVGDKSQQLARAVERLRTHVQKLRASSIIETAPLLPEGAPEEWNVNYANMAVCGEVSGSPQQLLVLVKSLEQALGRIDRGHWGPREIDIDILFYADEIVETPELTIPHRGILEREFALIPAAEIAPEFVHPIARKTLRELAQAFGKRA